VTKVPGAADALAFPAVLLAGEPAAIAEATEVTRLVVVDGPSQHGPTRMIAGLGCAEFAEVAAAFCITRGAHFHSGI